LSQNGQIARPPAGDEWPGAEHAGAAELVGRTSASATGRALVPTAPVSPQRGLRTERRSCGAFLAQLIATALKAPQTRLRRRADPGDASAVYAAAAVVDRPAAGQIVRRSM
jgi:hypothetical protein